MKRFLVATSSKNNDVSKKTKNDSASDSADSPHTSEEATELDCCDSIEQINVSQSYLFDVSNKNDGKKLVAKCVLCTKVIRGQINSTGNFLSHLKTVITSSFKHPSILSKVEESKRLYKKTKQNIESVYTPKQMTLPSFKSSTIKNNLAHILQPI
ncbi:Dimer Tnp hAT domain-containing protein [Aphis craccivora]|uniref:Dimer Tnp hAT domain-containing protein n=1 Tax=Aphis craccivora TaxID=307492 RepID=A0A6G0Z7J7_APHCR|nr:Dimer Tnp hAT domain-containing protein [Aphis craccivora]